MTKTRTFFGFFSFLILAVAAIALVLYLGSSLFVLLDTLFPVFMDNAVAIGTIVLVCIGLAICIKRIDTVITEEEMEKDA